MLFVTSLADSGPGTLRAALEKPWPRTVVFRVGGTITLQSPLVIRNPYVTVAGQTAPGGGIQIRNDPVAPYGLGSDSFTSLVIETHDVVIRFLRIRPGPLQPNPACSRPNAVRHPQGYTTCVDASDIQAIELAPEAERVMLDHLSLAWASDEIVDVNGASEVSLQWSIVAEGLDFVLYEGFFGSVTTYHGHGVIIGDRVSAAAGQVDGRLSFHHNLFALLVDRAPQITVSCPSASYPSACATDVVNNYVYGWEEYGVSVSNLLGHSFVNVVNNYFRQGPDTEELSHALSLNDWETSATAVVPDAALGLHLVGNRVQSAANFNGSAPVTCGRFNPSTARWHTCNTASYTTPRHQTPPITTTAAEVARDRILADVGASRRLGATGGWVLARDAADVRVVENARNGTGRIIDSYGEFPGWPSLANAYPPNDHDQDGMPDRWEDLQCFDATRRDGTLDADADGYTNLEEFLNGTPPC